MFYLNFINEVKILFNIACTDINIINKIIMINYKNTGIQDTYGINVFTTTIG